MMKICTPVFLPYETKVREFDGRILLIDKLIRFGFTEIYLGSKSAAKAQALKSRNGIFILKSLALEDVGFYKALKERGFIIFLLHVEGAVHYKNNAEVIWSYFNPAIMEYIDYNLVFGCETKNAILKYCGKNVDKKTIVTGEPRFDLLSKTNAWVIRNEIDYIRSEHPNLILVNTSFSAGNPSIGADVQRRIWEGDSNFTKGVRESLLRKMDFNKSVFQAFLEAIRVLAENQPNVHFVVRPHPSEKFESYTDALGDLKNVFVDRQFGVASWIQCALGVVHYDCTTGIESVVCGKPTFAYTPILDEELVAWLPIHLSKQVFTSSELLQEVKALLNDVPFIMETNKMKLVSEHIENVKSSSVDNIVLALAKCARSGFRSNLSEFFRKIEFTLKSAIVKWVLVKLDATKGGVNDNQINYMISKFVSCNEDEIRLKLKSNSMPVKPFPKLFQLKRQLVLVYNG